VEGIVGNTMKIKAMHLPDAYGRKVRTVQRRETVRRGLGEPRQLVTFEVPEGYLKPKTIVLMKGQQPVYTGMFVMINPSHVLMEAPAVENKQQACLLNLRQASYSVILGGRRLSSWIDWDAPLKMQQDRGWFRILDKEPVAFFKALCDTGVMEQVPGDLHRPHKKNFELVESFKTKHRVPVLQVTLWQKGDEWVVELDIDLCKGLEHWKEVIKNHLTGEKTNPYLVNQLLAWNWGVVSFKLEVPAAKPR
tara:strand:+ start:42 stop:788 length:747 start_codon:yes stop_codon:yes gene_type:complete